MHFAVANNARRGAQTAWNAPRGSVNVYPRSGNGMAAGAAIRSLKPEREDDRVTVEAFPSSLPK